MGGMAARSRADAHGQGLLIGLTGAYCAGKNAVACILAARGFEALDVDKVGHEALELVSGRIREAFGEAAAPEGRPVDRKALGRLVFGDPKALALLESIVHPQMFALVDRFLEARAGRNACLNAAILYKMPQLSLCDAVFEVRAPFAAVLRRAKARDGVGWQGALARMRAQKSLWRRRRERGVRPIAIRNTGSLAALERAVDAALARAGFRPAGDSGGSEE